MTMATRCFSHCFLLLLFLFFCCLPFSLKAQNSAANHTADQLSYQDERLKIEWLFADEALLAGDEALLAFRISLSPGWHIYWRHAGDSGTPPRLEWLEPADWRASDFIWPAPQRIEMPPLVNFGYEKEVYLPFFVAIPSNLEGDSVLLVAELDWLVCEENCIPGQARFQVRKPVSADGRRTASAAAAALEYALEQEPRLHRSWQLKQDDPALWELIVELPEPAEEWQDFDFFPYEEIGVSNQDYQFQLDGSKLRIKLPTSPVPASEEFAGVLRLIKKASSAEGQEALTLRLEEGGMQAAKSPLALQTLWSIILFAFLGGLILNLMPCVLPVLSIKLMQMLGHNPDDSKAAIKAGLMYTAGVLLSFLALASILILIKSAGSAAGWGFQLQSPYFVAALACLFFFLGLNFLGVISPWDSLTRLGNLESQSSPLWQQFSSGVLAVIVASPCTGPFMGVSIGYALAQPSWVALLLFAVLGLGFALPFLLLGIFPKGLRFLPKPGAWMETLRQFMAFPLFATVLWLLWVLARQVGEQGILMLLAGFLLISFGAWLEKRFSFQSRSLRITTWSIIGLLLILLVRVLPEKTEQVASNKIIDAASQVWQSFSPELLTELKTEHPVFIDFTAAWCVTCQVNKRLVLRRQDVMDAFLQHDFKLLEADWTDYDPVIGQTLESFGRNGVPLYVIYPKGKDSSAIILPEILTPDIVFGYIERSVQSY